MGKIKRWHEDFYCPLLSIPSFPSLSSFPLPPPRMPPANAKSLTDDAAMRKKKNADAQAAFRARRANYIATLEEAGKSALPILIHPNPL